MESVPTGSEGADEGDLDVPLDEFYSLLSDEYRRSTLSLLAATDRPMAFDEVVAHLLAGTDGRGDRERVELLLHHNHLPMLADAGLIEYDGETVRFTAGEVAADIFRDLMA